MKGKISVLWLSAMLLLVSFSGCIGNDNKPVVVDDTVGAKETVTTVPMSAEDAAFVAFLDKYKQRRLFSTDGSSVPDRAGYRIPLEIFGNLPAMPADFLLKTYLIKVGKFFDIGALSEGYWKQPEFDPDFSRTGLRYWREVKDNDYKKTHWSTSGVRSYPYEQYVSAKPGYMFNVSVILSSDWSVETYQGIRIKVKYLSTATMADGRNVNASPEGEKYIDTKVTPEEFLLTPAYPIFTADWSRKLTFTGNISNDTPEGTYILSYDLAVPSPANSEKWFMQNLNLYSEGVQMVKIDKPYLQAFINVRQ